MKLSLTGLVLALIYTGLAAFIAWNEFNCTGGLDINLCGLISGIVTLPAQFALEPIFSSLGWKLSFTNPTPVDFLMQAINIAFCAGLVYLIGWGLGWIGARLLRVVGLGK